MSFTTVFRPHKRAAKTAAAPTSEPRRVAKGSRPILHLKPAAAD